MASPRKLASARTWRLFAALTFAAAVAVAGAGAAYAYLSVGGSGTGSASTGSVILSVNSAASHTCSYSSLSPGDLTGSATCALSVIYTGSVPAYVSLTVAIQSEAGPGGSPLYDGSGINGLTLSVSDGHNSFTVPTGPGTTGGTCPVGDMCWTASNELSAWYSGTTPNLVFASGDGATFTITPLFAKAAGNPYQGGSASVSLTAQAVQSPANTLPASCTTSTIGKPCPASGSFSWS